MLRTLREQLQAVLDRLSPPLRTQGQRDVDSLLAAGVVDYEKLLLVIQDRGADEQLRAAAIWVLPRLVDERAVSVLLAAIEDSSPQLRSEAARALGELRSVGASDTSTLVRHLLHDASAEVRTAAAYALGLVGDESALEPLASVLANVAEDVKVRGIAAEALADLRDPRAVPALIAALADPSAEVRYWCAFALGELGDPAAIPPLEAVAAKDNAEFPGRGRVSAEASAAIERINERRQ